MSELSNPISSFMPEQSVFAIKYNENGNAFDVMECDFISEVKYKNRRFAVVEMYPYGIVVILPFDDVFQTENDAEEALGNKLIFDEENECFVW